MFKNGPYMGPLLTLFKIFEPVLFSLSHCAACRMRLVVLLSQTDLVAVHSDVSKLAWSRCRYFRAGLLSLLMFGVDVAFVDDGCWC